MLLGVLHGGWWEFWETYDPVGGPITEIGPGAPAFGNQKVTFDGTNKLILVNAREITIEVKADIYSNWKEWTQVRDNSKFLPALTALGGDPITDVLNVGNTYFLENGWRIQPSSFADHTLNFTGNLFTREVGEDPFISPVENVKVSILISRSNLVDLVEVGAFALSSVEQAKLDELYKLSGLQSGTDLVVTDTTRDAGAGISQTIVEAPAGTITVTRV